MTQTLDGLVKETSVRNVVLAAAAGAVILGSLACTTPPPPPRPSEPKAVLSNEMTSTYDITQFENKVFEKVGEIPQGRYEQMKNIIAQSGAYDSIASEAKRKGFNLEVLTSGEKQWLNEELWRIFKKKNGMRYDAISPGVEYNIPTANGARELVMKYVKDKETIGFEVPKGWNLDRIIKDIYGVDPYSSTGKKIRGAILQENKQTMGSSPDYIQAGRTYRLPNPLSGKYSDILSNPAKSQTNMHDAPRLAGVNSQYARNIPPYPAQHRIQHRV